MLLMNWRRKEEVRIAMYNFQTILGTRFKSVFISIAITVGMVVFGWTCTTLTNTISLQLPISEFYMVVMQQYAGITVNISTASNFFVFYFKKYATHLNFENVWNTAPSTEQPSRGYLEKRKVEQTTSRVPPWRPILHRIQKENQVRWLWARVLAHIQWLP